MVYGVENCSFTLFFFDLMIVKSLSILNPSLWRIFFNSLKNSMISFSFDWTLSLMAIAFSFFYQLIVYHLIDSESRLYKQNTPFIINRRLLWTEWTDFLPKYHLTFKTMLPLSGNMVTVHRQHVRSACRILCRLRFCFRKNHFINKEEDYHRDTAV